MNFQVFHVNPGKKLKKKDVNNNLSHFMSVFPSVQYSFPQITFSRHDLCVENSSSNLFSLSKIYFWLAFDRSNGIDCERGQKIHIRIFNFIKSCRTCVNIFEILIPHFMKVGGSLYLLQNSMDDSPICGYEFSGHSFCPNPNQLTFLDI